MQRPITPQSRGATAEEKRFHAWLKQRPCAVTGREGVDVHHCVGATFRHNRILIGHVFCLPLAPEIHREFHQDKRIWIDNYGLQCDIWHDEYHEYCYQIGHPVFVEEFTAIMDLKR